MMRMVEDLLNVSRLELGKMAIAPEEFDIREFFSEILAELKPSAELKRITLSLNAHSELPKFFADKNLVHMILQNVLTNAIKYSKDGGTVDCELSHGSGDNAFIRVTDSGIGIPKDEQDKVFEKLHRASNAVANVPDGTGLGLYLIKTILERVHGGITLESTEGKGTSVYVTLPATWKKSTPE
jgi:signal transduction histidine kinase